MKLRHVFAGTILTCAAVHILVVAVHAVRTGEWFLLNVFYIMHLHLLYPPIIEGALMFLLSYAFLAVLFGVAYVLLRKRLQRGPESGGAQEWPSAPSEPAR